MNIEEKLIKYSEEILEKMEDLSHWEGVLVLEMVRSAMDMTNMARALTTDLKEKYNGRTNQ